MTLFAHALTPARLGQPKIKLQVSEMSYSHERQMTLNSSDLIHMATTWNSTQTYGSDGKPKDKDND